MIKYTTRLVTRLEALEEIRHEWDALLQVEEYPHVESDIDRYTSIIKSFHGDPLVLIIYDAQRPIALLMARKITAPTSMKIGYSTLCRPNVTSISVGYKGVIGKITERVADEIVESLNQLLKSGESDFVSFNHLPVESILFDRIRNSQNFLCRDYWLKKDLHWFMDVKESVDHLYSSHSAKTRNTLRRKVKKLEQNGDYLFLIVTKKDELINSLKHVDVISRKTYQHALGAGVVDDGTTRSLLATAAEHGWLRLHLLMKLGIPCAFQLGFVYRDTYFLQSLGYDPDVREASVGTVLFLKVYEDLCREVTVKYFDFGFGDADYKRIYGSDNIEENSIAFCAWRIRPIFINLLKSALSGVNVIALKIANKLGVGRAIKRKWRDYIQGSNK